MSADIDTRGGDSVGVRNARPLTGGAPTNGEVPCARRFPASGLRTHLHVRAHKGGHGAGGHGSPGVRPGTTEISVNQHLLAANDRHADGIRTLLGDHQIFCANLMSSPGAGKTALLEATLDRRDTGLRTAVIEGDIETSADADRLAPFAIQVVQVNTGPFGGDCHLAAPLVATAVDKLDLHPIDLLIVENVGNLVCPAEFDIGEDAKVVLLSVTEGEDKPLKYPLMFHEAALALVTKTDLLPYLDTDLELIRTNIRKVNPSLPVICVSSRNGEGMDEWVAWLREGVSSKTADTSA